MTPAQKKLIHFAVRDRGLSDAQYRLLLANVAEVDTSKDLDHVGFESVMAVLEDMGFRLKGQPEDYFRRKAAGQGAAERMVRKIHMLIQGTGYELAGMVWRMTNHRTRIAEELEPKEAWNLIEALKAVHSRQSAVGGRQAGHDRSSLPSADCLLPTAQRPKMSPSESAQRDGAQGGTPRALKDERSREAPAPRRALLNSQLPPADRSEEIEPRRREGHEGEPWLRIQKSNGPPTPSTPGVAARKSPPAARIVTPTP